MQLLP